MLIGDPIHDETVRAMFDEDIAADGYISNHTRVWAHRPDVCQGFRDLRFALASEMTLTQRETAVLIAATVAQASDSYCGLAWGTNLAEEADEGAAAAVLSGETPQGLSARERALAQWARTVVRDPHSTTPADIGSLRSAGFSDREIAETTMLIGFRLAFSTINAALGAAPDQQLADRTPERVRQAVTFGRPPEDSASRGAQR